MVERLLSTFSKTVGLNSIEIDRFLTKYCSQYIGIFASNTLPVAENLEGCLICNLSNSNTIGSHYITIIIQTSQVLYIDSFGTRSEIDDISLFLSSLKKPVLYNTLMIQDLDSSYCGMYAIMFCLYFSKKPPFKLRFSDNLERNDNKCIKYIKRMMQ